MDAEFDITNVILETPRLILREWKESDLDDLYEYASVSGIGENAGFSHHKNKEESSKILKLFIEEKKTFALEYKENNKVIGSIGVEFIKHKFEELDNYLGREIGYVLSKDYWGKGIMVEAVNKVGDYLFNYLNYDFLLSGYFSFNFQSKRVQEKCGFKSLKNILFDTKLGHKEPGVLTILVNQNKNNGIKCLFDY